MSRLVYADPQYLGALSKTQGITTAIPCAAR